MELGYITADGGNARGWDARPGSALLTCVVMVGIYRAAFSPDGTEIVTTSFDGTARVWSARTGLQLRVLRVGPSDVVNSAAFSPDGSRVVTTSSDGTVRVWNARTGAEQMILRDRSPTNAVFSPDGSRIVITGLPTEIWNLRTRRLLVLTDPFGGAAFTSDAAFSPDGSRVVTASDMVEIWDARTGHQLAALGDAGTGASTAAFSPDGARIVTADSDHTARVWDAYAGNQLLMDQLPNGLADAALARTAPGSWQLATVLPSSSTRPVVECLVSKIARAN